MWKPTDLLRETQIETFNENAELRVSQDSNFALDLVLWNIPWLAQFDKFWTNPDIATASTP